MRWTLKPKPSSEKVNTLATQLKVHELIATLLVQRGIETFEQARQFFRPSLDDLHNPYLMKDMDKAVARIESAIANGENILVFGDYDVDGTTAVSLVSSYLKSYYPNVATYIPDRYDEGYGISFKIVFEGDLDERNWVWDFGGMKRAKTWIDGMQPKEWMDYMFDHTFLVAEDDPFLESFKKMDEAGVAQLRILPATGAEQFAKFIYDKVSKFIKIETEGRVRVVSVEFKEHNKNSAIYGE